MKIIKEATHKEADARKEENENLKREIDALEGDNE